MLLGLLAAAALGFDPAIDQAREPPTGFSFGLGLERLDNTFGFWGELRSPRFWDEAAAVTAGGGFGWLPERLMSTEFASPVGPWSPFGHGRVRFELALRLAELPHRLFVAAGPSLLFPSSELSTEEVSLGGSGGFGVELFAGDRFRTLPFSLAIELGVSAHTARADARSGEAENAATLATGFSILVSLRYYPAESQGAADP